MSRMFDLHFGVNHNITALSQTQANPGYVELAPNVRVGQFDVKSTDCADVEDAFWEDEQLLKVCFMLIKSVLSKIRTLFRE